MRKIKVGDKVKVMRGKSKGFCGPVQTISGDLVYVTGAQLLRKHAKGKIEHKEGPIHISNVMYCDESNHPTRIGFKFVSDGEKTKKVRFCKKTGATI